MNDHHSFPDPGWLVQAFAQLGKHVNNNVQQTQRNMQKPFGELAAHAASVVHQVQAHFAAQLAGPVAQLHPLMASMTSHAAAALSSGTKSNPLFDVAFNPEDIKSRLAAIPVYAVVNQNDEFVLVSGEEEGKQLGLFFLTKEDAEELIAAIKQQSPKLGKQTRVLMTTMDSVYGLAVSPRADSGTDGVIFRFMPDSKEVERALELYRHAGISPAGFAGVPLFQAEGLTVKSEGGRFTPLFFSKQDLDAALGDASLVKESEQQNETRAKIERAQSELTAAEAEEAGAGDGKARKAAKKKAEAAKKRIQEYEGRLAELQEKKKLPRVDVGSFEDVLVKMESDDKGEWSDVMFVPPGSLSGKSQEEGPSSKGKGDKKKAAASKKKGGK